MVPAWQRPVDTLIAVGIMATAAIIISGGYRPSPEPEPRPRPCSRSSWPCLRRSSSCGASSPIDESDARRGWAPSRSTCSSRSRSSTSSTPWTWSSPRTSSPRLSPHQVSCTPASRRLDRCLRRSGGSGSAWSTHGQLRGGDRAGVSRHVRRPAHRPAHPAESRGLTPSLYGMRADAESLNAQLERAFYNRRLPDSPTSHRSPNRAQPGPPRDPEPRNRSLTPTCGQTDGKSGPLDLIRPDPTRSRQGPAGFPQGIPHVPPP